MLRGPAAHRPVDSEGQPTHSVCAPRNTGGKSANKQQADALLFEDSASGSDQEVCGKANDDQRQQTLDGPGVAVHEQQQTNGNAEQGRSDQRLAKSQGRTN